jgi:phosphoribosyl-ATP pyrophosphohydrolase
MLKPLEELVKIIRTKKKSNPNKSYTKQLLNSKKICTEKVKEELNELIEAIINKNQEKQEAADLIYHLFVFFEVNNIRIEDVMNELKNRQSISGLEEKSNRG